MVDADFLFSSYRERVMEHLFVGEVLREMWLKGQHEVEVLRAEVDGAGYDLVLESRAVVRHIQLKAARAGGRRASVGVNVKLAAKPSGCVVWFYFDPETLRLESFLWFGDAPGKPLPDLGSRVAKHTKGNSMGHKAARPNIRELPKKVFTSVPNVEGLVDRLFG